MSCLLTAPLGVRAVYYLLYCHVHGMEGYDKDIKGKEYKKLLVLLAHTVVHPGAVMVHLTDTAPANLKYIAAK